jgi:hypothetical protein
MSGKAASIDVSTTVGATEPSSHLPVSANASFTTFQNGVELLLFNNLANPRSVAQLISDISFSLSGGQTSATIFSDSTSLRIVDQNGHYITSSVTLSHWGIDSTFAGGIRLTALGFIGPAGLIIGPTDNSNVYSAANASIAGNGPHNPFSALAIAFFLDVPGVNTDTLVNNVVFSFGTTPRRDNVSVNPSTVPDGGTTIMFLGAALSGLCLIRRKLS